MTISQGFWDPVQAVLSLDPVYGGNIPYTIEGGPVRDKLSFFHYSRCLLTSPDGSARAEFDDMRTQGCNT